MVSRRARVGLVAFPVLLSTTSLSPWIRYSAQPSPSSLLKSGALHKGYVPARVPHCQVSFPTFTSSHAFSSSCYSTSAWKTLGALTYKNVEASKGRAAPSFSSEHSLRTRGKFPKAQDVSCAPKVALYPGLAPCDGSERVRRVQTHNVDG